MSAVEVTGLYIYPVKSMRGIALKNAQLTAKGLSNDRRWMVVRANGRFVTQRDIPRLALVHTRLDDNGVVLSMQGHDSITVPLSTIDESRIETRVWNDRCQTVEKGEEISRWLTQALGSESPLKLVAMKPGFTRALHHADLLGEGTTTNFADAAPFLVAGESSLERLNDELESRMLSRVPMNRFRPNIVVRGLEPFAEHKVTELSATTYGLKLCYPCERCVVTTINQETAEKDPHKQPFHTLASINPMPGNSKAPAFAENASLLKGDGEIISVGDVFNVTFRSTSAD